MNRAIVMVIDSGGVGAAPDCERYGDASVVDTLGNTSRAGGGLSTPVLERLGLGTIARLQGVERVAKPLATCARLREMSNGKDTITGHWEMMGITVVHAFPTYPNGFPRDVVERFEALTGT